MWQLSFMKFKRQENVPAISILLLVTALCACDMQCMVAASMHTQCVAPSASALIKLFRSFTRSQCSQCFCIFKVSWPWPFAIELCLWFLYTAAKCLLHGHDMRVRLLLASVTY